MLKKKIAKLEDVEEQYRGLYKQVGEEFVLQIEGDSDNSELTAEVERLQKHMQTLLDEKKSESEKRKQAEDEAKKQAEDAARKKGDIDTLEKSWAEQRDKDVAAEKAVSDELRSYVQTLLVDNVAQQAVSGFVIPGSESLAVQLIKSRLTVEYGEGSPKTRILDGEGKPSALTIDQLKQELSGNPAWAPLILASKASGGGASGGGNGGGAAKKFTDYSEKELVALNKENPGEYNRLRDEYRDGQRKF